MPETVSTEFPICPGCGRENDPGMSFCIYCGQVVALPGPASTSPAQKFSQQDIAGSSQVQSADESLEGLETQPVCKSCGKTGGVEGRFCIFCGCDNSTDKAVYGKAPPQKESGFFQNQDFERSLNSGQKVSLTLFIALSTVLGLIFGWVLVFIAFRTQLVEIIASKRWPSSGFVLYADPPKSFVRLLKEGEGNFTFGRTGVNGALAIPDLKSGKYTLEVSMPGYKPFSQDIEIKADKALVVGFPERIKLER